VVASQAPVISGVGHETDFSIADFAADLRAPTPTAAAELATPDRLDLLAGLADVKEALRRNLQANLRERAWALQSVHQRLERRSPEGRVAGDRQRLDELSRRAERALRGQARHFRTRLLGLEAKLSALNPAGVLARGFAVVSMVGDGVVSRVDQVQAGDLLQVRVSDGRFGAQVTGDEEKL
jgi:exodeoxyribonuclease VII large subunit